ncbi:membrane protein [Acrocarpospora phusangensis]|uniref:Membrane protein n=1 Tax=Acrocarpospora phusangensis TaxID=1070424 RepID=A0A919UMF5_9ACTN|nr:anthrone oxygenase family protein [Acrocarpospora phusangensis]GIH26914.1 membrane protein [Acrocarpospora phusangensis]
MVGMFALTVIAAFATLVLTGWIAGVFYAYSVSVMWGLDAAGPEHAVPVMRQINAKIQNPVFFLSFLGTIPAGILTGVLLLLDGQTRPGLLFLASTAVYLAGTFIPTIAVNIPLNNAIDRSTAPDAEAWAAFYPRWTRWNHGRTVFSGLSLLVAGIALATWASSW